jgi:hypothetical protein
MASPFRAGQYSSYKVLQAEVAWHLGMRGTGARQAVRDSGGGQRQRPRRSSGGITRCQPARLVHGATALPPFRTPGAWGATSFFQIRSQGYTFEKRASWSRHASGKPALPRSRDGIHPLVPPRRKRIRISGAGGNIFLFRSRASRRSVELPFDRDGGGIIYFEGAYTKALVNGAVPKPPCHKQADPVQTLAA